MSSSADLGRHPQRFGIGSILLANLLPLGGVLWFGWEPSVLVVIYGLELLFTFPLAGVKALFAQQPSRSDTDDGSSVVSVSHQLTETRGSVRVVSWLPPIYPRNLPFAAALVNGSLWFLIMFGVVLSSVGPVGDVLTRPEVLVSVFALVIAQSVETWREYLRDGYKTASAYSVIETPARQAFFLTFVLVVTPGIGAVGIEGILGVIVVVKLLTEWSTHRATNSDTGGLTDWLAGPDPTAVDRDPVDIPDTDPEARIATDGRAALYTGVFDVFGRLAPFVVMPFIFGWFIAMLMLGDGTPAVVGLAVSAIIVMSFIGYLAARVLMVYLQYGFVEYRRYGDQLVAYDTLLNEPQWSTPISTLRNVQIVPDRLADRLVGTRTVVLTTGWSDHERRRYLGPTAAVDELIEAFELPVRKIDLEPLDRRPAAVIIAALSGFVTLVVLLGVGPWVTLSELLSSGLVYGIFGLPVGGLVLRFVWVQSYPDRTTEPVRN